MENFEEFPATAADLDNRPFTEFEPVDQGSSELLCVLAKNRTEVEAGFVACIVAQEADVEYRVE